MEFLFGVAFVILTIVPMLKLLPHFGIKQYWALACILFPFGVVALIWWMSLKLQEMERR